LAFYDTKGTLINEFYSRPEGTKVEKSDDKHDCAAPRQVRLKPFHLGYARQSPAKIIGSDPIAGALIDLPSGSWPVHGRTDRRSAKRRQPLTIVPDAYSDASQADLDAQFEMLMRIDSRTGDAVAALNQMRDVQCPARMVGTSASPVTRRPSLWLSKLLRCVTRCWQSKKKSKSRS
jgi:hypothetical protein